MWSNEPAPEMFYLYLALYIYGVYMGVHGRTILLACMSFFWLASFWRGAIYLWKANSTAGWLVSAHRSGDYNIKSLAPLK